MLPSGRKHTGKSGKTSVEDQLMRAFDLEKSKREDRKGLSGSEENVTDGTVYLMLLCRDHVPQFICFGPPAF